jgi:hypothetical protein
VPQASDNNDLDWLTNISAHIEGKEPFAPLANPDLPMVAAAKARDRAARSRLAHDLEFVFGGRR